MLARPLTECEIEFVTDFIAPPRHLPAHTARSIAKRNMDKLASQLRSIRIVPDAIPELKDTIMRQYYSTLIHPGDSVGILTAQSIGERQTQQTLNTFHSTGLTVKTVVTGVPRFTQLINASQDVKRGKTCTVYYEGKFDSISDLRRTVGNSLRQLSLSSVKRSVSFTKEERKDPWYPLVGRLYGWDHEATPWSVRWVLDPDKVFEYHVELRTIARILEDNFDDVKVVFSPQEECVIDLYIDTSSISADGTTYRDDEEAVTVYLEEIVIPKIEKFTLHGIEGIEDIFFEQRDGQWVVETEGSNLSRILALPGINFAKTTCNYMWEIYECLGIEAARNFLIKEFNLVVGSDNNYVHQSHIMLLADVMTFPGSIISVSRYTLKKDQCGPFSKASFEESLENFLMAGCFAQKDSARSVSASIMLGKTGLFGTGLCDLVVDVEHLPGRPTLADEVVERL